MYTEKIGVFLYLTNTENESFLKFLGKTENKNDIHFGSVKVVPK